MYLMPFIYHEVEPKQLKAALPPQWVQLVSDSTEGMCRAGTHLWHKILLDAELHVETCVADQVKAAI